MLVDPWLVGELTFLQASWIYSGEKVRTKGLDWQAVAARSDFMLITQVCASRTECTLCSCCCAPGSQWWQGQRIHLQRCVLYTCLIQAAVQRQGLHNCRRRRRHDSQVDRTPFTTVHSRLR